MELVPFHHGNWQLRTTTIDGTPWFVAGDVARALGYRNAPDLTRRLDDDEKGYATVRTPGGDQQVSILNESGLLHAVLDAQTKDARQYRRWVTGEVLPEIHRTGSYAAAPVFQIPTTLADALQLAADQARQIDAQTAEIAVLAPAARFATTLAGAMGDYSVREAAGVLNRDPNISTGERRLFAVLRGLRWLDRTNQPYQGQVDTGRLVRKLGTYEDAKTGEMVAYTQVRITPKGLKFLHQHLGGVSTLVLAEAGATS